MLTVFFDRSSDKPIYEQLYEYIKKAIIEEELRANEKLPSKRKLAAHLKVSIITIESAYNQLMAEGYITSKPKSGFYVLPYVRLTNLKHHRELNKIVKKPLKAEYLVDFRTNQIDDKSFPYDKWSKLEKDVLLYQYQTHINKTDYQGLYSLRESISEILFQYRGIETSPESIVIGSGSEHLISLLVLLLGRDNTFGVEMPGYLKNFQLYKDYGANAKTFDLDELGVDLSKVSNCDILHVTPSHQFPLGIVTPIARRIELLNWAYKKAGRYIIEDDYDSEFRFSGNPIPALKGLDNFDRVIYMNSFSKSIAPSLRVSFMVLPDELIKKYHEFYSYFTCSVPVITQMVLDSFIKNNEYERHLNRMKNIYKNKRDELLELLLNSSFGDKLEILGEEAGLHFLVKLKTSYLINNFVEAAKKHSIRVYGINEYCLNKENVLTDKLIIFGYSHLDSSDFIRAVKSLELAWNDFI